jgi:hypothetical protein
MGGPLLEMQVIDPASKTWYPERWIGADEVSMIDLRASDRLGRELPVRLIVQKTGQLVLENDRAKMLREAQEAMARKRDRKPSEGQLWEREALNRAISYTVTVLDDGVSPDARRVFRTEKLAEAAQIFRSHSRALLYAVLPGFRQAFVTAEQLTERGL